MPLSTPQAMAIAGGLLAVSPPLRSWVTAPLRQEKKSEGRGQGAAPPPHAQFVHAAVSAHHRAGAVLDSLRSQMGASFGMKTPSGPNLSGQWRKSHAESDSMSPAFEAMKLNGLVRKAAGLISKLEIEHTPDEFEVKLKAGILGIAERYPMTGEIREYARRDKRRGNARTRVEVAQRGDVQVVHLISEWDEPHAARAVETFILQHEPEREEPQERRQSWSHHESSGDDDEDAEAGDAARVTGDKSRGHVAGAPSASVTASLWPMRGGPGHHQAGAGGGGSSCGGGGCRKLVVETALTMRRDDGTWDEERTVSYRTVYLEHTAGK